MKKSFFCITLALLILFCVTVMPSINIVFAEEEVYLGGFPIGISVDVGGLLIERNDGVQTEYGTAFVDELLVGDLITQINGKAVADADDIKEYLTNEPTTIVLIRNGEKLSLTVKPLIEAYSGTARLGIKVKEKIYGIGTMSYITKSGKYAALGHEMFDSDAAVHSSTSTGKLYDCRLLGIKKGDKSGAGALLGSIIADKELGNVTCNNNFGIAGKYTGDCSNYPIVKIANRNEIVVGSAKMYTTIDSMPTFYDVEIIKVTNKNSRKEKSLIFRVVDNELLQKTGGVVRGMSGSPILQNNKLIGVVTHVFLSDFTKGYGIFADALN